MPVNYRIIGNVVIIQPVGAHGTQELRDAWLAAERDPAFPRLSMVVSACVDVRESESLAKRSVADMRATTNWFIDRAKGMNSACAFVARPGIQYGLIRMISAWLEFKNFRVRAMTDLDEAVRWLQSTELATEAQDRAQ